MDSVPTGAADSYHSNPMPFSSGFHLEGAKQQLIAAINARKVTDRKIGTEWAVLPAIAYIAILAIMITILLIKVFDLIERIAINPYDVTAIEEISAYYVTAILLNLLSAIPYTLYAILTHKILSRHNEHSERESHLRMGILSFLRAAAGSPEKEYIISSEVATMTMLHNEAGANETRRTALFWALVIGFLWVPGISVILAILSIYMFYFLMNDNWHHDRRFHEFMTQAYSALYKLGYSYAPIGSLRRLEKRSFVFYLVLSILTAGLFVLYWWYTLVKDPNEHYQHQWLVEDHLVSVITQK